MPAINAFDNVCANVYVNSRLVKGGARPFRVVFQKRIKIMSLILGVIADDITGATDIGLMLARNGLPTTLCLGLPSASRSVAAPAVVIALKIRNLPPEQAVAAATAAADWLLARGARQLYYKYCSTFDSTPRGNIGPVTDALLKRCGESFTVLAPAFPDNGRTVVGGELLVHGQPLAESPMKDHPLTPMKDSSLQRLMDAQTEPGSTGRVPQETIRAGHVALAAALQKLRDHGYRYAVPDCEDENDIRTLGVACRDMKLLTGAAGLAAALPHNYRKKGLLTGAVQTTALPRLPGHAAVLAGSCSAATRNQVERFRSRATPIVVDPLALARDASAGDDLLDRAAKAAQAGNVLVCSSADPERLRAVQSAIGVEESADIVERALSRIAAHLADCGVRKFVVAGGETSGAVADALAIDELGIGPAIDHGVPWMIAEKPHAACLAFKSGNFGDEDFFQRALDMLP